VSTPAPPRKPAILFIFVTLLLDVMGFGLLIPVGPSLIASLLVDPATGKQGMPIEAAAPYVGWLAATFYMMAFLFAPLLGALSDKIGRRPVILFSLLGSGLDYIAMAFAPTVGWLFVTRAFNGLTGASFAVASAYVADITPPEKRAGAFGMIGAAFGLGFIFGPLLGGWLGNINIHYPFYAAAGLTLVNWLWGLFVLPESVTREQRASRSFNWAKANPIGMFPMLAKYQFVAWMAGALFLLNLAQFSLHATWAVYTEHRYHWSPKMVGVSLFVVGLGAAIVQGGLARKLIPALGLKASLILGLCIGTCAFAGYGLATQGWMILAIAAIASLGGIAQPANQSLVSQVVSMEEQGAVQGALSSLQSVAGILGPILGSQVLHATFVHKDGSPGALTAWPGLVYLVASGLCLLGLLLTLRALPLVRGGTASQQTVGSH
jgi:MFS transporter, DHA1 family, tetracycline resistance protein